MLRKIVSAALASVAIATSIVVAQKETSVWDGVYSDAQAKAGEALYIKSCASCHGKSLQGEGQAPPLAGSEFLMNWNGATVGELFEKIQTSMPADTPGALSAADTASVIALLLNAGKFPPGANALPGDAEKLRGIRFEPAKKK